MSAYVPEAVGPWPPQYAALLETYTARPSTELLQRAAELGRALGQARVPLQDLAATHMSALGELVHRPSTPSHDLLAAATPLFCCLVEAYDTACPEPGAAEARVGRGTRGDGGPPIAPGASSGARPDLETLLSNLPGIAYRCRNDRHWTMEFVSEGCYELTGYQPADLIGNARVSYADLIHPDDRGSGWDEMQAALVEGRPFQLLYRIRCADGTQKWVWEQGRAVRSETGGVSALEGFITDVSERKQAEEALRESEERFRAFFDDLGDAAYRADTQGNITYVNKFSERLTGLPPDELIGKPFLPLFTPQSQLVASDAYHRTLKGDSPEYELTFTGGRTCRFKNEPLRDEDGKLVGVFGIARDITEHKRAEEELRRHREHLEELVEQRTLALERTTERLQQGLAKRKQTEEALGKSEERLRSLVEATSDWVWEVDQNGVYTYASPRVRDLLGYEPSEVVGKTPFDFMPADEAKRVRRLFRATTESREPFAGLENTNLHRDGRPVVLETSGVPILDAGGNLLGYRGIDRDITERKRAEEALRESEGRYRSLVENIDLGISLISPDRRILMTNAALGKMFNKPVREFTGKNCFAEFEKRGAVCSHCPGTQALATGRPAETTTEGVRDDGSRFAVRLQAFPVFGVVGEPTGFIEVVEDITAQRQAREKLKETTALLQSIMDSATEEMIVATDPTGIILSWNEGARRLLGYEAKEVVGKDSVRVFHTEEYLKSGVMDSNIKKMIAGRKPLVEEIDYAAKDGRTFPVQQIVTPRFDEDGEFIGMLGLARDITEHKQAERELRLLSQAVEGSIDGIAMCDPEYRITYMNEAFARMFGYSKEELTGKHIAFVYSEEQMPRLEEAFRATTEGGWTGELIGKRKSGERFPVAVSSSRVLDDEGNVIGGMASHRDITERKRAEEELRKFKTISDQAAYGAAVSDIKGNLIYVNTAFAEMHGYKSEELIGANLAVFHSEEQMPHVNELNERLRQEGDFVGEEVWHTRVDGSVFPTLMNATVVRDEHGGPSFLSATAIDITKRKQAEELLRIQRDVALALSETTDLTVALDRVLEAAFQIDGIDGGGVYLVNQATGGRNLISYKGLPSWFAERTSQFGADSVELRQILEGKPLYDRYLGVSTCTEEALQRAGVRAMAIIPVHDAGQIVASLHLASFTQDDISLSARHTLEAIAARLGSVVARVRAVTALRESEERFDLAARGSADGLWDWNAAADGATWWSPRYFELLGYEDGEIEADFNRLEELLHADDRDATMEAVRAHLEERVPYDVEYRLKTKSGQYRWLRARGQALWDEDGRATRMAGSLQDINDRKRAEEAARRHQEQLAHVSRVSTMGEMASGLAHELAQPLSAILYYARSCASRLQTGAWGTTEAASAVQKIATQADRAAEFIRRLKAFVRKARPHRARADLNLVVREALGFAEPMARDNQVTVKLELDQSLPGVVVDTIQIEQVILNLVRNGIEAIVSTPPGQREVLIRTSAGSDDTVCVSVQDTGPGLTPETAERIFDPFFTTKPAGMGLGLSISRSIIDAHEGTLWVSTDTERGALFGFTLPVARDDDHDRS